MGLTKRSDSYYVEFRVMESEDGKSLVLASGVPGARKKRWKVGCLNKTAARDMESTIRTRLLLGQERSERAKPTLFKEWAKTYLELEEVKSLRSFVGTITQCRRALGSVFSVGRYCQRSDRRT